ncbi:MAG: polysulfide reductase NrfD [Deltaproteobacteria bacterium]|nr:polysulfide reductase NrfD [Deltaproteobacteria bacterium]
MSPPTQTLAGTPGSLLGFVGRELKPKGKIFTPFNLISAPLILLGLVLIVIRFAYGLGSVTNLSQAYPWGLWIGFDVITGVAFAGGAYVLTFMVYILGMEKYRPIVRATVLNGFLAYAFYAGALLLDLGRPWNIVNPIIGNSFGYSSVLFLVAWHFLLYMAAQFLEFSPVVAEWLGLKRARKILAGLTVGAVIFGVTLSTLHQSGLGALFLMAKGKIHPLWYSEFIPVLFFWSSIFAGLSMVIIEGSISHRVFHDRLSPDVKRSNDAILVGLSRICGVAIFGYLFMKVLVLIHDGGFAELASGWGGWFLLEVVGFVAVPMVLFLWGAAKRGLWMIRIGAGMTLIGIILNRLNISVIAFKWYEVNRYVPSWEEIAVTLAVILAEIWVFRWVIRRMPVLSESPSWAQEQGH